MSKLKVVTFNIRCPWDEHDGINCQIHRMGAILDKLDTELPDAVCFQEVPVKTADFLTRHLPEYEVIWRGRDADLNGEGLAIALRRQTVEFMSADFFWLSPTPYVPGSRYEVQSNCPRICLSAMIRMKEDGKVIRLYDNHLDHRGEPARVLGMKQVVDAIAKAQSTMDFPVFVMGDMNDTPESECMTYARENAVYPLTDLTDGVDHTFHGFGTVPAPYRIDYIYSDAETAKKPHDVSVWKDEQDGIYLSDHYPICLTIKL